MNNEVKQVEFNEPPIVMQETILAHVQPFVDQIPNDKKGGVFGILTTDNSGNKIMNAVIAVRIKDRLEIAGYIGKTWGKKDTIYGIEAKFFF